MDDFKYKIEPKPGSKVKRIATTGIVLDFKKGPVIVPKEVLKNKQVIDVVDILEKIPVEVESHKQPEEKETTPGPGKSRSRKNGGE